MNGKTFEEFHAGDRYSTGRRTITEHDILTFVNLVGLTEPLFLDMEYIRKESFFGERIAPGSLTFGMAEGLDRADRSNSRHRHGVRRSRQDAPVQPGAKSTTRSRWRSKCWTAKSVPARGGGIVRYRQWVKNQRGETIMEYDVARLIRGAENSVKA